MVPSDSLQCQNFPPTILHRQESFIHTLDLHPEYKLYVHSLCWTILPFKVTLPGWYNQDGVWRYVGSSWQVLGSLTKLEYLDLHDLSHPNPSMVSRRGHFPPMVQLEQLKLLRLGGCIDPKVGEPLLLHIDLSKLTQLFLNDVFMQRPFYDHINHSYDYYDAFELFKEYEKVVAANAYVNALAQKCCSLKLFEFETHGVECVHNYPGPLAAYLNAFGYKICGTLIEHNSATLEILRFRHGTESTRMSEFARQAKARSLPFWQSLVNEQTSWMDHMFGIHVYSKICRNAWPSLKKMFISGVESWRMGSLPWDQTPVAVPSESVEMYVKEGLHMDRIRGAVGPGVQLQMAYQNRFFDPFKVSELEDTADSDVEYEENEEDEEEEDEEEDEEDEEDEDEEDEEDEDEDDKDGEVNRDEDEIEEIQKDEYERTKKTTLGEDEIFSQWCNLS